MLSGQELAPATVSAVLASAHAAATCTEVTGHVRPSCTSLTTAGRPAMRRQNAGVYLTLSSNREGFWRSLHTNSLPGISTVFWSRRLSSWNLLILHEQQAMFWARFIARTTTRRRLRLCSCCATGRRVPG